MDKFYKSLICFSLGASNLLFAQEMQESSCENPCFDMWMLPDCEYGEREVTISAQHREANGIGYKRGYSSLDLFWNLPIRGQVHPFIDFRGHITNDGHFAANAGVGVRSYFCCVDMVLGANVFYDYRNAPHIGFQQIGAGFEAFSCDWDFHLNGYFPVGRKKKLFRDGFYQFKGNRALFQKMYNFSMTGGDVDIGCELFLNDYANLHAKVGGYYFHGRFNKQAIGGLFRLKSDITPYISVEGQVSYDSLFKDIYQGMAALNFPIGSRTEKNTIYSCNRRAMQMVDRFEMIVAKEHRKIAPAIDPITGKALKFIFVNNTSSSSGTFKSPYPTLLQAQNASNPGDVIYVFPGDGTTSGMNQGISLQSRQQLIGSGAPAQFLTRFGLRTIPAQTKAFPTITAPVSVISFTDAPIGNVISGLNIEFSTFGIHYIPTSLSPIQNLTIINNNFIDTITTGVGIGIENPLGNILIADNYFGPSRIAMDISWSNLAVATFSNVQIEIFRNQIVNATNNAIAIDIDDGAFLANALVNVDVSFNTFLQGNGGNTFLNLDFEPANIALQTNISVKNNHSMGAGYNWTFGAFAAGATVTANATILNNTTTNGFFTVIQTSGASIDYNIQNNQFLNSTLTSSITLNGGGIATLNLVNNTSTVANNAAEGFTFTNTSALPMAILSPNALLSGVAQQNLGSSPLVNSDTTIGPITTSGSGGFDYELPPP